MIKYRKDTHDIVTLTLDRAGSKENVINHQICQAFRPVIQQLRAERATGKLQGVIITSAKKQFLTGGDLEYLYETTEAAAVFRYTEQLKSVFRDLETLGVPVVAAMNGTAIGSGFELALACHHRIVVENPLTRVGLPEVNLGLMPSGGGVTRLVWLNGLQKTFPILTEGKLYRPKEALRLELIDEVVADEKTMFQHARAWIFENLDYQRPWDRRGYKIPGGDIETQHILEWIGQKNAEIMKLTKGNYPAVQAIFGTMVEAVSVDFDTANRIGSRFFTNLLLSKTAHSMIKTFWFDKNAIKNNLSRPKGYGKFRPKNVGIIGAGKMGSSIATVCAKHGFNVMLKDVSKAVAEKGRKYCDLLLEQEVKERIITEQERKQIFERISITEHFRDFKTCDVVIEAVFEDLALKRRIIREAGADLDEFTLFGTNTSNISISKLAKASHNPQDFIGIHFYAPADKQPLVDIILGKDSSDEILAKAFDFVRAIGKIPIVLKDRRGFLMPRINGMYALEGLALLNEGVSPVLIERLGVKAGMPQGPLAVLDQMSLATTLIFERRKQEWFGENYYYKNEIEALHKMVHELNREGVISKAGFYDYTLENPCIWNGLYEHFDIKKETPKEEEIIERLMFVQAIDALRALEEGTVGTVEEANIGSALGWGFAPFKGGVIQFIDDYGREAFGERAKTLEDRFGSRFKMP